MACDDFERESLDRVKNLIRAYEDAILALVSSGVEEYRLDTGQGTQRVKRSDIPRMQETVGLLWQQYDSLNARCNGGGAVNVTPGTMPRGGSCQ